MTRRDKALAARPRQGENSGAGGGWGGARRGRGSLCTYLLLLAWEDELPADSRAHWGGGSKRRRHPASSGTQVSGSPDEEGVMGFVRPPGTSRGRPPTGTPTIQATLPTRTTWTATVGLPGGAQPEPHSERSGPAPLHPHPHHPTPAGARVQPPHHLHCPHPRNSFRPPAPALASEPLLDQPLPSSRPPRATH